MEPKKVLTGLVTEEAINRAFETINSNPEFTVEGCHYMIVREDRYQDLFNFLRDHFIPDEPLSRTVDLKWDKELQGVFQDQVEKNMSLALVSDTTGEIVSARLTGIAKKRQGSRKDVLKSEGLRKIFNLLKHLEDLCSPFEHYGVEEVIGFLALGVHKDYRQRGIGTKVMKAEVELMKNLGLGPIIIKGEGTSNYSKRIYEKLGFDILSEVIYDDYKENDELVFKNMRNHTSARLYGKSVSLGS